MQIKTTVQLSREEVLKLLADHICEEFRYKTFDRPPGKVKNWAQDDEGGLFIFMQTEEPEPEPPIPVLEVGTAEPEPDAVPEVP